LNVCAQCGKAATIVLLLAALPGVAHAAEGLNLVPNTMLMLGLMVVFLLLVYPLNALLFKPVFAVLDERDERIDGAKRRAEQLQEEADDVIARYRAAVTVVRDESELARRGKLDAARGQQSEITSTARGAAEAEIARARSELGDAVDVARASLRGEVEELARQAAERIAGRELS